MQAAHINGGRNVQALGAQGLQAPTQDNSLGDLEQLLSDAFMAIIQALFGGLTGQGGQTQGGSPRGGGATPQGCGGPRRAGHGGPSPRTRPSRRTPPMGPAQQRTQGPTNRPQTPKSAPKPPARPQAPGQTQTGPVGQVGQPQSSNGRGDVVNIVRGELGVREATGRNDGVPAQRYSNGRKEPWCANFVSWAHRQAGTPIPGNQRSLASVQNMEDRMKANGMFHKNTPKPGDVIFFKNRGGSDRGPGRHVGIVERVDNGRVHTIEGNSSNRVRRRSYDLNNARISGYGRVPGKNQPAQPPGSQTSAPTAPATQGPSGPTATSNVTGNATGNGKAAQLDRVLGGALKGQGHAITQAAQKHGVDPKLLSAILMHETGNGTSNAVRNYNNPGGIMDPKTNWSKLKRFGSLQEGLDYTARNLKRGYIDKGLTTVEQIQKKYAPVGAGNDPNGLNRHWVDGVNRFLGKIG